MEKTIQEVNRKYNSEEYIRGLLAKYNDFPCLWKVKSKCYSNRNMKEDAYKELVKYTKDTIDEHATVDVIKKKIGALRRTFRRELLKVKESKKSGAGGDDIYTPHLWYYSLLLFTSDQEEPRDTISNDIALEELQTAEEKSPNYISGAEADFREIQQSEPAETMHPTTKRKKLVTKDNSTLLAKAYEILERPIPGTDEYDNFGVTVAAKLRKMDAD
ncbi:uncharacterized protein LOC116164626 [Photinus pyralis]|nr:uncharacterized protein LOC116164626 [Photinus pyralis]